MQTSATMPQLVTVSVFLIKRLHVELMVNLRSTGLVKIEPYHCKEQNLRLWSGIAQTQTVLAQTKLGDLKKNEDQLPLLLSLFQQGGWEVKEIEERKEVSL